MSTVGVLVISVSGMDHLNQCLESVKWADAVMVVHVGGGKPRLATGPPPCAAIRTAGSAVEVQEILKELKTDWILRLWGEERVGADLKEELCTLAQGRQTLPLTYRISIRSLVLDCWVRGSLWSPSPARRFDSSIVDFAPEWWNEKQQRLGMSAVPLKGSIDDYTLATLSGGFKLIGNVSNLWAEHLTAAGGIRSSWSMFLRPFGVFVALLWMNRLGRGGLATLTFSTLAAYATLLSDAKVWEGRNVSRKSGKSTVKA